jgi:hypothetical protein
MSPRALCTYHDFVAAIARKKSAYKLVHWLLYTGRFPEYWLAEHYRAEARQGVREVVARAAGHQRLTGDSPALALSS